MHTIQQVMDYNPIAVFVPGKLGVSFFPGVKVAVFHGYPIQKEIEKHRRFFFHLEGGARCMLYSKENQAPAEF